MNAQERDIRLQIMLQPKEMELIEEWRFRARMPSRAAAVRELIRRGLEAEGFDLAPQGKQSGDFMVSGKPPLDGDGSAEGS